VADVDNISGKAAIDGLRRGGILKDDNLRYVKKVSYTEEAGNPESTTITLIWETENQPIMETDKQDMLDRKDIQNAIEIFEPLSGGTFPIEFVNIVRERFGAPPMTKDEYCEAHRLFDELGWEIIENLKSEQVNQMWLKSIKLSESKTEE
jgi:hypothetical protein